jgi:hypothetical protein
MTAPIRTIVHTLGDSTLDNLFWHINEEGTNVEQAKKNCVEGQLRACEHEVVSHAYDGFTTKSVLEGDIAGKVLPWNGKAKDTYLKTKLADRSVLNTRGEPNSGIYTVQPLSDLKKSIEDHPSAQHVVVISVGGNDFREQLHNPIALLKIVPEVQARYMKIVKQVKDMGAKTILMFQYRPDAADRPYHIYSILGAIGCLFAAIHILSIVTIAAVGQALLRQKIGKIAGGALLFIAIASLYLSTKVIPLKFTKGILSGQGPGMTMMGLLMEKFYRPILEMAQKQNLAVLDLPNIFNPNKHQLYISGTEPSKEGGKVIAMELSRLLNDPQLVNRINNPNEWTVRYPSKVYV